MKNEKSRSNWVKIDFREKQIAALNILHPLIVLATKFQKMSLAFNFGQKFPVIITQIFDF